MRRIKYNNNNNKELGNSLKSESNYSEERYEAPLAGVGDNNGTHLEAGLQARLVKEDLQPGLEVMHPSAPTTLPAEVAGD